MGRPRKKMKGSKPPHDPIGPIPTDIIVEILERLPVKSLGRFICVSKSWEAIIRSKAFIRSFTLRSSLSQPPPLLLAFKKSDYRNKVHDWSFCSSSNLTSRTKFQVVNKKRYNEVHQSYVHGLMSFMSEQRHVVINPSTGKSVTLPDVVSRRQVVKRFFGYDPVGGEYKVLCIVKANYGSGMRIAPNEDQVLTLGTSRWRKMKCTSVPHRPICNGLCIDGVVYYFAYVGNNVLTLVKFDVKSEELSFVTSGLLKFLVRPCLDLMPYERKVAIAQRTSWENFDLWVLKDAMNDEWLKICITIPSWSNMVQSQPFRFVGTAHTGEIILTHFDSYGGINVTYHNHKDKSQRKVEILSNVVFDLERYGSPVCFLDYKESVMLL